MNKKAINQQLIRKKKCSNPISKQGILWLTMQINSNHQKKKKIIFKKKSKH